MAHSRHVVVPPVERPLGELVSELTRDMGLLVRQEFALAKAEMTEKATQVMKSVTAIGIGAGVLLAGALTLVAALVLGLVAAGVRPWLAALIVGGVFALVGFALLQGGRRNLARTDLAPRRTAESVKQTAAWAKEQVQ